MKKTLLLLALCLTFGCLTACQEKTADAAPAPSVTAAPTAAPTPVPTPAPVSVNGQSVPADAEAVALSEAVADPEILRQPLAALPRMKALSLDRVVPQASVAAWMEAWADLEAAFPEVTFTYTTQYEGGPAEAVTAFAPASLPEDMAAEAAAILALFPQLKTLDLTALVTSREAVAQAAALMPEVSVQWNDEAFGPSDSTEKALTLTGPADLEAAAAYLGCFPGLEAVDLLSAELTEAEGGALSDAFPQVTFHRVVTLNGKSLDNFTEEIALPGAKIGDYEAFAEAVGRFPKLKSLDLSDCSLTNEELDALRTRYPQAGVVWVVKFSRWSCRTDAVAFTTGQSGNTERRQSQKAVSVLRYCTDLVALDLGHNAIDDISWLEPLQNLQVLILADNRIRDISPLASLKKLKYVELFMNPVTDITPLSTLPELLDVNLCITHTADLTPLIQCTKLERIWIGHQTQKYCSKESLQAVQETFPNAQYDLLSVSCTNRGWREHPRYDAYTEMFKTNTVVAPFLPED